jgi:hypothetical protein
MRGVARAISILALVGIVLGGIVATRLYRTLDKIDRKIAEVQEVFRGAFHAAPRLVVNHRTAWGETSPIAELAVVEREGEFDEEWKQTFLHSTKKVFLHGRYRAKAGFDLTRDFSVRVERGGAVTVFLPPAKILSVENVGDIQVRGENGLLNWLTDADIQAALHEFRLRTAAEAENSTLKAEAEEEALKRLRDLAAQAGTPIRFEKEAQ